MTNLDTDLTISIIVGASSGIGRSLACAFGRERRRVALVGRRRDALDRVADEVTAFGGSARVEISDTRDRDSIDSAITAIRSEGAAIDTVILSQGIAVTIPDMQRYTSAELRETFDTNLFGVAHWLEALQPILAKQETPSTVAVISSLAAHRTLPGGGANYAASKAALSHLCDGLRPAWRRQGIRLVTVEPGFVRTPMTSSNAFMPALMEPEDAARAILDGIRRGDPVIRFPRVATCFMRAISLLPEIWVDSAAIAVMEGKR